MTMNFDFLICVLNFAFTSSIELASVTVDTTRITRTISDRFISVAIDSGVIRRHWETFQPRSTKVITLASALVPSYLRVGGTDADFLIFDDGSSLEKDLEAFIGQTNTTDKDIKFYHKFQGDELGSYKPGILSRSKRDIGLYSDRDHTNYTMTAEFYDELHKFVSDVGFDLIFDLNVLLRKGDGWDSRNAEKLMNYTVSHGYKMAGWELGNEPDDTLLFTGKVYIPPAQLAKDFRHLQSLLKKYPAFDDLHILGPSVCQLSAVERIAYFNSFLTNGGKDVVTGATFHQYYINGRTATVSDFINPDTLNILYDEVQMGVNLTRLSGSKAAAWIGETSSAWGGGAEGLSDRYVAAFMWLDKLGIAAAWGVDVIIRQTFYGGHYALIDRETLDPNPDYWLTLMYKILVGTKVLRVNPGGRGTLRSYAHCVNSERSGYQKGAVVLYIMNLGDPVQVQFPDFPSTSTHHLYTFTPKDGDIKSQTVLLNGTPLKMVDDSTLPNLLIPVKGTGPVEMDSHTYTFVVFPDANVHVCI